MISPWLAWNLLWRPDWPWTRGVLELKACNATSSPNNISQCKLSHLWHCLSALSFRLEKILSWGGSADNGTQLNPRQPHFYLGLSVQISAFSSSSYPHLSMGSIASGVTHVYPVCRLRLMRNEMCAERGRAGKRFRTFLRGGVTSGLWDGGDSGKHMNFGSRQKLKSWFCMLLAIWSWTVLWHIQTFGFSFIKGKYGGG